MGPQGELWDPPVDLRHLSPEQQQKVKQMLREESHVFAKDDWDTGCIKELQMNIQLKHNVPVQRLLNQKTLPDRHPIPRIQEILENIGGNSWFTVLDQGKAYHQGFVCEQSRPSRKSARPDGISPRLLRTCADQLSEVLSYIYNLSLSLEKVPVLWKTSCVIPVPKTAHAKEPAHYRPVALTSHLMKTMKRLILNHLRSVVSPTLDPLQFAYMPNIGVEAAVIYFLQWTLSHLEPAGSAVRVMFFDFSSAFNTIRPTDHSTCGCGSEVVVCSTGAPQGTVLSTFLFTIYTSDFTYDTHSCHLQKFSAIVGCVFEGNQLEYRSVITDFVDWCERNHLCLNTSKTKEMIIDFRRKPLSHTLLNIQGKT
uniref:ribonuclease H n=1 Tax=Knipowitschia caucasica TaxID=637954 RepID=A0AAV2LJ86_KNICA